jgi:hypothetical protein
MPDSQTMKIIIEAQDKAKAALDSLAKSLKDIGKEAQQSDQRIAVLQDGILKFRAGIKNLVSSVFNLKTAIIGLIAAWGGFKIYEFIKDSTLLAARYTTLGVTLEQLGKQAGYNAAQLKRFEEGLIKTGIASTSARQILSRMIQSQLDLTKATDLARVAQNAAVIAGLNSSETFERMLHAIQANSVEILRTIGMNVSFENSYKKFAKTLDISVGAMTEAQKVQARFNAVLEGGTQIVGAYESAMGTAGKQLLSFERYAEEFRIAIGQAFEPALVVIVESLTKATKEFTEAIKDEAFRKKLEDFAVIIGERIQAGFKWLIDNKELILQVVLDIADALGNVVKTLTFVLDKLVTTQEDLTNQNRKELEKVGKDLALYIKQREELLKKIKEEKEFYESGNANIGQLLQMDINIPKMEREVKQLDIWIKQFRDLGVKTQEEIEKATKKTGREIEKTSLLAEKEALQRAALQATLPKSEPEPLGSNLLKSTFKKTQEDIKLQLVKIESLYDENLVSVKDYYSEKRRLAEEAFTAEETLLKKEAEDVKTDPDKRLKVEDKIYALRKQFAAKSIALNDDERKAFEKLAKDKLDIEKGFLDARLALAQSAFDYAEVDRLEIKQLKLTQKQKLDELKKTTRDENLIKQQQVIDEQQVQQLILDQDKKAADRRLDIEQKLFDQKYDVYSRSTKTRQSDIDKLELEQLKKTQAKELEELKKDGANRDQLREQEILHNQQLQITEEQQTKSYADRKLDIEKTLIDAKNQLIDPNNLQAQFEAERQQLEQFQADRLQSIIDAKLNEVDEIAAIEEANRLSQLEKDKQQVDQRIKIQEFYISRVGGVLSDLNSLFGDLYEASGEKQKKFFKIQKAIAVAQATIATYESAVKAFNSFAGIPYVGTALGIAAAAAATAAGLAKVAVIKSQTYAEGGIVKGYSPHKKADNIQANLTAGEFVQPVDVVKYYGIKGMELLRQKLIPPEILYQATVFNDKKESIKNSFENNLAKTNNFIRDYSKKLLSLSKSKTTSPVNDVQSAILRSKERIISLDKTVSNTIIDKSIEKSVSDSSQVIVDKLFEKFISDKSSTVKSNVKKKYTKELITDVRRDKESTSRDRVFTYDYNRNWQFTNDYYKDTKSTKDIERTATSDRSSERFATDRFDRRDSKELQQATNELLRSKIFVSNSIERTGSFLNNIVKETIEKQKVESVIKEALYNTAMSASADKSIYIKDSKDTSEIKIKKSSKSIIDKVIDNAISDKLVNDRIVVDKSFVTQSIIDKVVERLSTDKLKTNELINISKFNEVIDRSAIDRKFESSYVDRAIDKSVKDRIAERSQITTRHEELVRDKLSDSIYKLSSDIQSRFTSQYRDTWETSRNRISTESVHSGEREFGQKSLVQNIIDKTFVVDRKQITDGLLKSSLNIIDIGKSKEIIESIRNKSIISPSTISSQRKTVDKSKTKSVIDKSIGFIKNITKNITTPIQNTISAIAETPMVLAPVVISDITRNKNSIVRNYQPSKINSNFIKSIQSGTKEVFQRLAGGGSIRGSSPHAKADNITIKATAGEFMHPVDVVKYYTKQGMEAIRQKVVPREVIAQYANNIHMPPPNYSHAFAVGGEIPKTRDTSGSAAESAKEKQFNIVNLIDPVVFQQYLSSSPGQEQFVNVISANKFQIKGILES